MKKRFKIYGALAAAFALYVGFLGICSLVDNVSENSYQELKLGMTKWEVRRKLGFAQSYSGKVLIKGQVHVWLWGDGGSILLAFDDQDRLIWKDWDERFPRQPPAPFLENLPIWLGLVKIRDG